MAPKTNAGTKGKDIWSLITIEQLATAISSLGDRINQLNEETWRLNIETRLSTSLWAQIIEKLKIDHNEKIRHSLYNIWHLKRRGIDKLVEKETMKMGSRENAEDDVELGKVEEASFTEKNIPKLPPNLSLPLPQRPNTRTNQSKNVDDNGNQNSAITEISFTLTASEWKAAFSRTHQKMNDAWRKIFSDKLESCGITCAASFRRSHVKKGKRKQQCIHFWCRATCTNSECTRSYFIALKNQPDVHTSALFLVRISGIENHNPENETMTRHLYGEERYRVGK